MAKPDSKTYWRVYVVCNERGDPLPYTARSNRSAAWLAFTGSHGSLVRNLPEYGHAAVKKKWKRKGYTCEPMAVID